MSNSRRMMSSSGGNLSSIKREIQATISCGAPVYNSGDHASCARLYRGLAHEMLDATMTSSSPEMSQVRAHLQSAVDEVHGNPGRHTDNAWALRRAMDSILEIGGAGGSSGSRRMSGGSGSGGDIEDIARVERVCQNPRACRQPNCDCPVKGRPVALPGGGGGRSSGSDGGPPRGVCRGKNGRCSFPSCSCLQVSGICRNPGSCQYPRCGCARC